MFSDAAQFSVKFVSFFVSSVCLLVRVNMVDKNKAVGCCLLAPSTIMLSENKKRKLKIRIKKRYLIRNIYIYIYISCDGQLLAELLKTDVEIECLEMVPLWCGQVN
jgi:hypothetical protein